MLPWALHCLTTVLRRNIYQFFFLHINRSLVIACPAPLACCENGSGAAAELVMERAVVLPILKAAPIETLAITHAQQAQGLCWQHCVALVTAFCTSYSYTLLGLDQKQDAPIFHQTHNKKRGLSC